MMRTTYTCRDLLTKSPPLVVGEPWRDVAARGGPHMLNRALLNARIGSCEFTFLRRSLVEICGSGRSEIASMFPWLRLLRVGLNLIGKSKVDLLATTRVHLRVWPNDLDFNIHANNARYLALADIGRI